MECTAVGRAAVASADWMMEEEVVARHDLEGVRTGTLDPWVLGDLHCDGTATKSHCLF